MADSCATCFFYRAAPASAGALAGAWHCHRDGPQQLGANAAQFPWVPVNPDYWCGEGADAGTGTSFSAAVKNPPL